MEYYTRDPSQLTKRTNASKDLIERRRSIGRFILLIDILLVVAVLFYYRDSVGERKSVVKIQEKKNMNWKGWKISSDCSEAVCKLSLTPQTQKVGKSFLPLKINWEKFDASDNSIMKETFLYKKNETIKVEKPELHEKLFFEIELTQVEIFRFRAWP